MQFVKRFFKKKKHSNVFLLLKTQSDVNNQKVRWILYNPHLWYWLASLTHRLTKMALTRPTSKTVGPRLKTSALRTKEMPRVPRSIALDSAPVCRLRWNPRSRLCRWRKTFLAMRRMELWATFPNTVFLSSLKKAAQARDPPSGTNRGDEDLNSCCEKQRGSDKEAPRLWRPNIFYSHPQQLRAALKL